MLAAYHYYYLPVLCAESVEVGAKYGLHLIRQAGVGEAPVTVYVPLHNPYS